MRRGILAVGALVVLALPAVADADRFKVTRVADGVRGSLRGAIDKANANAGDDTIVLKGQKRKHGKKRKKTFKLTRCTDTANQEDLNADGDLDYTDSDRLLIKGKGSKIRNTCAGERVLENLGGSLEITRTTLTGGDAVAANGGGIRSAGPLTLRRATVRDNRAELSGGGIDAESAASVIDASMITDNSSTNGNAGGVLLVAGGRIANSVVSANETPFNGGGIVASSGVLTIDASTIRDNRAEFNGGGINIAFANTTVTDTLVSGNEAGFSGGGIQKAFGTTTVRNTTLSGNRAGAAGGLDSAFETTTIESSTITGNVAETGTGGIRRSFDTTTIATTIVAGNSGDQCGAGVSSLGYNLASDASCDPEATDIYDADAQLKPLRDNGGPTFTHALRTGSPAIDRVPEAMTLPTDQRGAPRDADGDAGAYERVTCQRVVVNRVGTDGSDRLPGTRHADGLLGLDGKDRLSGGKGLDALCGGEGKDTLSGGTRNDKLDGGRGKDRCNGGAGVDRARRCEVETNIP